MNSARKLTLKAALVVGLGAGAVLISPPRAEALTVCGLQPESAGCNDISTCELLSCPESCPEVTCVYWPMNPPCVGSADVYRLFCGSNSRP